MDAHSPAALAVVRSLARRGLSVDAAGEEGAFNLAAYSRYPEERFVYPNPSHSIPDFLSFIKDLAARNAYQFIFPITDRTIVPLHHFRKDFPAPGSIVLPPHDSLQTTLDKRATLELAGTLHVPIPETVFCSSIQELEENIDKLKFPVVVKSRFSKFIREDKLLSDDGPDFCDLKEELIRAWGEKDRIIPGPLVQEMILGEGYGIFLLMQKGEAKAIFAHRRLREEDPLGARSSYCESIEPPPRMKEYAMRLLKEINWTGPAMVELKLDKRDGIPKLMEINGRFWGSLPLAIASGVDFPYLYYQMLLEERGYSDDVAETFRLHLEPRLEEAKQQPSSSHFERRRSEAISKIHRKPLISNAMRLLRPLRLTSFAQGARNDHGSTENADYQTDSEGRRYDTEHYKIGVKARYLYADFQHLINVLKGPPESWMTFYPKRMKTILAFLASFRLGIKYFNLDIRDPKPGLVENARFLFRELPRRLLNRK